MSGYTTSKDQEASLFVNTSSESTRQDAITLVMMPFLGGSWREWEAVMRLLANQFRCVGLDLPGFGDAAEIDGYSVAEMTEHVMARLAELRLGRFALIGHSMAGKVSMAVSARIRQDLNTAIALEALVLVASSPPSPEPMGDKKRAELIAKLGRSGLSFREHAREFIRENTDEELPPAMFQSAVEDVLRMNCNAWVAWLEYGSREDWADRIGMITLPALVIAGEKDENLGAEAQIRMILPHLRRGRLEIVGGSKHLIPMEQPEELARLIAVFAKDLSAGDNEDSAGILLAGLGTEYAALIASERVSTQTRKALLERGKPYGPLYAPAVFSSSEMTTLRAIADRVVPLVRRHIDFARRMDELLASGARRGWRFAVLPPAIEAYKLGLKSVEHYARARFGGPFLTLTSAQQDALLESASRGELELGVVDRGLNLLRREIPQADVSTLTAIQMKRWFEDLRADLTSIYVSHPATLAEMGYSGIADGEDSEHLTGFVQLGLDTKEAWEPNAHGGGRA